MQRRFRTIDVFGTGAIDGNPLAVVVDAEDLTTEEMLAFTRWMNLSETSFLLPATVPGADYRVRIFCPDRELPFAGHPTLGSCRAWLDTGATPRDDGLIVQECGAGLVPVRRQGDELAFAAPPPIRDEPVTDAELDEFTRVLGITPDQVVASRWADNGPGWVVLALESAEAVRQVRPRGDFGGRLDVGLVGPHPAGSDRSFEVRALFTDHTGAVREDPVTGSLNAAIAQWLFATGQVDGPYVAGQGHCVGRNGRVSIDYAGGDTWVGGRATVVVAGEVEL